MQTGRPHQSPEEAEAYARQAYRWLLADPRGRYVARELLRVSGLSETGPRTGEAAVFANGARMVGNFLNERMQLHDPEGWLRFEGEYVQERHELARQEAEQKAEQRKALEQEFLQKGAKRGSL